MRASRRLVAFLTLTLASLLSAPTALARSPAKVVQYRGYTIVIPRTWPVYDLSRHPTVCVRFNRHAVYLGQPTPDQRCPAHAVGRTEAILLSPLTARGAGASLRGQGQLMVPAHGVSATATWGAHPGTIERALGVRSTQTLRSTARSGGGLPRASAASVSPRSVFTGLGFDACSAPSAAHMNAWGSSPYRAIGIYIGGTNMACSQPNLTSTWVSQETAAGWHFIPTYVGLQAPSNSCGCTGINPGQAHAQGTAAASDAVAAAQSLGIGAGNPIYFDMEAYSRGGTNTSAVLAFLSSWTAQLHADGYVSGVYSSAASGMQDLVAQVGTGYTEPDDIWIADWNGQRTTSDPYVPSGDWASHHRLHQYSGSHNETYGGVTINIDGDYLDGATAGANAAPVVAPFPSLSVKPGADGVIHLKARWYGVSGITAWRVLGGATPSELTPIGRSAKRGSQTSIAVHSSFPWFEVQALGSGGQTLGTSKPVVTPAFIAIYGRSVFVSRSGVGGVPAGCFTGKPCRVATTITAGRSVIARTGPQSIPAGGAGVLHYALSSGGRAMLARAAGHRLSVRVALRDASGITAANTLSLARFSTRGHGPRRSLHQGGPLRVVGTTHFVSGGSQGGILAGCFNSTPCRVTTTIVARHTVIARTGGEFLGAHELGYLTFKLTARGRALLAGASGNQLGVHLTLTAGTASAGGDIALVRAG